jgi:hypothetical protein
MLSPFDSIYLFPYILLSRAESPDLSLALKMEWIFNTSYDGWFGCDIELYPWPHFGIGTRSVWSPSRFGFNIGLCLWLHFGIGILVAFQRD